MQCPRALEKGMLMLARTQIALICALLFVACEPSKAAPKLESGPMSGFAAHHETALWLRLSEPGEVRFRFWAKSSPTDVRMQTARSGGLDGRTVSTVLTDLSDGTVFEYLVDVKRGSQWQQVQLPYRLQFQTQQNWARRAPPPNFTLAFGSCAYINDPMVDGVPERPYGGGFEIFDAIADASPDFMLWLGDAIYLRPGDWGSREGIYRRYGHVRKFKPLQRLLSATHHSAIWDDHDYGPNDSNWTYVHKGSALEIFKEFWANPSYGLPNQPGVFGQFSWGDVDFFLLDNRYHRSPSNSPDGHDKTQLGDGQLSWLLDALASSKAAFKVVIGGGQFLSPYDRFEGYAQFSFERDFLLDEVRKRRIEGILFLSGDRHHSELVKITPNGFYPLYDFTSSPLTSRGASASHELDSPVRVDGTLIRKQRSFGMLSFSGPPKNRVVKLEAKDAKGQVIWTHEIKSSELKFAQP